MELWRFTLKPWRLTLKQCYGAGAGAGDARSQNFLPEPELEPVYEVSALASGSGSD
jgi:hypothetical protein